ncbi:hypothetical protein D3C85_1564170 [compost metagenome]
MVVKQVTMTIVSPPKTDDVMGAPAILDFAITMGINNIPNRLDKPIKPRFAMSSRYWLWA